jgi:hypothetical protein
MAMNRRKFFTALAAAPLAACGRSSVDTDEFMDQVQRQHDEILREVTAHIHAYYRGERPEPIIYGRHMIDGKIVERQLGG